MCRCHRRHALRITFAAIAASAWPRLAAASAAITDAERDFLAEARRMKEIAIANGDQAYGAVIVMEREIVGFGPSRVVIDANPDAHAERVALWDSQSRLGRKDLAGAVIYSTSRPCGACQNALALAGIARMVHGAGIDAGPPRRW